MPQRRWRIDITSVIILALVLAHACAADSGDSIVRVGLVRSFKDVKQVTILASSDYTIAPAAAKGKPVCCSNLEPVTIASDGKTLTLKRPDGTSIDIGTLASITAKDAAGTMSVDSPGKLGRQYRGAVEVSLKPTGMLLVNVVGVEDYLVGVLAGEMPSSYPIEALKAQAVAARNFALQSRGKHISSGYDLCDSSHCQTYDGALGETVSRRRAVLATAGQVLMYNGRLASTMYGADCGGVTECYSDVHRADVPYLAMVTEPAGTAHGEWKKTYTLAELSSKLLAAGFSQADGLRNVSISTTSSSGRALAVNLAGAKGSACIEGAKLRRILGLDAIRSTLFTIETTPEAITFKGKGWGHGFGLCQVGAKALAGAPFNYPFDRILAHYYPGTKLTGFAGKADQPPTTSSSAKKPRSPAPKQNPSFTVRVAEPRL